MENSLKIKVDFEGKVADELMNFVIDTQEGKYTKEKPVLNQITYKRMVIEQEDCTSEFEDNEANVLLFGISN